MRQWRPVVLEVLLWLATLFLVWVFVRQGWSKFSDDSGWARAFRHWHYPDWFRVAIGVLEVLAAALLLWRRSATVGAILIAVVMLGGMATHIYWGKPQQVTSEILPLVLATLVAFARRKWLAPPRATALS